MAFVDLMLAAPYLYSKTLDLLGSVIREFRSKTLQVGQSGSQRTLPTPMSLRFKPLSKDLSCRGCSFRLIP